MTHSCRPGVSPRHNFKYRLHSYLKTIFLSDPIQMAMGRQISWSWVLVAATVGYPGWFNIVQQIHRSVQIHGGVWFIIQHAGSIP